MASATAHESIPSTRPPYAAEHVAPPIKTVDTYTTSTDFLGMLTPATTPKSAENLPELDQALIAPESWQIFNGGDLALDRIDVPLLSAATMEILTWLQKWVSSGSTLFIHWRIYQDAMPRCLQDAYVACATYFGSIDLTKELVFRIIERNVEELVQDLAVPGRAISSEPCGLVQHLARTQAMLIYQAIRLYDGDIRQRSAADKLCPTLDRWNREMLACALQSSQYVRSFSGGRSPDNTVAWQAWCLAESVRRTWATSNVVQNAYHVLKGEASRCPGHLRFTARAGLWDARSALEWMEAQQNLDPLFYDEMNGREIVARANLDEIDAFGRWALRVTGTEMRSNGLSTHG